MSASPPDNRHPAETPRSAIPRPFGHPASVVGLEASNLLRGPYKRNEYRKVILPLTVLRRFDCLLEPTKEKVLAEHAKVKAKPESVIELKLRSITERPFYNLSRLTMAKLLDDPNQLAPNLNSYINGFSKTVRDIMDRFAFDQQIARMAEKNLLYEVIQAFVDPKLDLSATKVDGETREFPADQAAFPGTQSV